MADKSISIQINDLSGFSQADLLEKLAPKNGKFLFIQNLINHLSKIASGQNTAKVYCDVSASSLARASGVVVFASAATGDTITLNGVAFTAVSGTATGKNFKVTGHTDAEAATSFAAAVNFGASGEALVKEFFSCTTSGASAIVAAKIWGLAGNACTLASSDNGRLAVSGARLTGGLGANTYAGPTGYIYGASGT